MLFKKCTIVVFDDAKGVSHSMKVNSIHYYSFKYYVALFGIIFLALICISFSLYKTASEQAAEQHLLLTKVKHLEQQIPTPADTLNASDQRRQLESRIERISEYLHKRGVKGFSKESVGGRSNPDQTLSSEEDQSLYDEYLDRVFEGLISTPTGYPTRAEITSYFGYRRNPFHGRSIEFHTGIDFRGNRGDQVKSTAKGRVIFAGYGNGYGKYVHLKHKSGHETIYAHLSNIKVAHGDQIIAGQVIGEIGSTGRSTGNHLHYEVRKNDRAINPVDFLKIEE